MTLEEAMHTECQHCGEDAGHHRLTDGGNFYCLEFNWSSNRWARNAYPIIRERKQVAQRANCRELKKSPLSSVKEVAKTILLHVRGIGTPDGQLSL